MAVQGVNGLSRGCEAEVRFVVAVLARSRYSHRTPPTRISSLPCVLARSFLLED
jgi:hypothetical protein